jgi:hypothetical protein
MSPFAAFQFEYSILPGVVKHLLEKADLSISKRGNPVEVTRMIAAMVRTCSAWVCFTNIQFSSGACFTVFSSPGPRFPKVKELSSPVKPPHENNSPFIS